MNPWLLLGIVVAFVVSNLGSYFTGKSDGADGERLVWTQRENTELTAANAKIAKLHQEARDAEAAHAMAVNLISTTLQGETDAARAETERLKSAARAGTFRLRDPAASRKDACRSAAAETPAGAGQRDEGKGTELSGAASAFLLELTGEADEVAKQLAACQAVVIDDRKVR